MTRLWRGTARVLATPALSVLCLVLVCAGLEWAATRPWLTRRLPPPSYGTASRMLDLQWQRLAESHERTGIDCVFFGSSPAHDGLEPAVFADRYADRAGWRPNCFNASLPGMRTASSSALARVALEDLDPWLVIYGYSPRDLALESPSPRLMDTDWLRYRTGTQSLRGALIDRSRAYRLFLGSYTLRQRTMGFNLAQATILRRDGFFQRFGVVSDPEALVAEGRRLRPDLDRATVDERATAALRALLGDPISRRRVAIVQMPIHAAMDDWLTELPVHDASNRVLARIAGDYGVPLWRVPASSIPANGWADPTHTNPGGAAVITEWVADRVWEAAQSGKIEPRP